MNYTVDVTHTSHCYANTGIQRVVRNLYHCLSTSDNTTGICYDPYAEIWRHLDPREQKLMLPDLNNFSKKRKARWTLKQKLTGATHKPFNTLQSKQFVPDSSAAFIAPEIFSHAVFQHYSQLLPYIKGPKLALFYDAIALALPQHTPQKTVARMPQYLNELLSFDGIAAISQDSADVLQAFWQEQGIQEYPPVQAIPLATEISNTPISLNANDTSSDKPVILCVSTIEGRKNQLTLLKAAEMLWDEGEDFELQLIGIPNIETGTETIKCINKLVSQGYPLVWDKSASDEVLQAAYNRAHFTVYPSLMEGFGLPIIESLQQGKPCVCSGSGAIGEVAAEGGCCFCDVTSPGSLATAMKRLLADQKLYAQLANESRHRHYKSWSEYTQEVKDFMDDLVAYKAKSTEVVGAL